ncbi:DNA-directed RNA polymerase subunit delta [Streptococcaceae bacterium ESL0729]|nr:DNA-directed RNA polymerase subunit delta [Streptococcaceae bacterium ESL0729]
MKIKVFEGQNKNELSMIEVAHAMLEQHGKEMEFSVLVNAIQDYLGRSDADIRANLSTFYTDLNTDGSFIPLGGNVWALRAWYAIDEINEEVIALDEVDDEDRPKKKRKKVNAFADIDDVIDYSDDDPEDDDYTEEDIHYDDENPDDEKTEVEAYDSELAEVVVEDDDEDGEYIGEDTDDEDDDEDSEDDK